MSKTTEAINKFKKDVTDAQFLANAESLGVDDGGSSNLDYVKFYVRKGSLNFSRMSAALRAAAKETGGSIEKGCITYSGGSGQANRRYVWCQVFKREMLKAGWDVAVRYILD